VKITIKKLISWGACYYENELKEFKKNLKIKYGVTPLEFAELDIKTEDKIWTLLRPEIIPEKELHLLGCTFAEDALKLERKNGREPHPDSWDAIKVKRKWVAGKATEEELKSAESAAESAAGSATGSAWSAANSAANSAAYSARSAAGSAESAWSAAWLAARSAAESAAESARSAVEKKILKQIKMKCGRS